MLLYDSMRTLLKCIQTFIDLLALLCSLTFVIPLGSFLFKEKKKFDNDVPLSLEG